LIKPKNSQEKLAFIRPLVKALLGQVSAKLRHLFACIAKEIKAIVSETSESKFAKLE